MVIVKVRQFIDGQWHQIGDMLQSTSTTAMNFVDEMEIKMQDPDITNIPVRLSVKNLVILNIHKGPVRFDVVE